jgi:hypothetical protein
MVHFEGGRTIAEIIGSTHFSSQCDAAQVFVQYGDFSLGFFVWFSKKFSI